MTALAFALGVVAGALSTVTFGAFAFLHGWFDEPFVNRRDDEEDFR